MDILTSPTHPTTTKQSDTPATAPPSDMSSNNNTDNQSTASDTEYETAFDKLQRLQSRLANPDDDDDIQKSSAKKKRRAKVAYGVSSLEALPGDGDEMTDGIDISTFAKDDYANRKSMFDDDELSNGNVSDGDDMLNEEGLSSVAESPKGRSKGRKKSVLQEDESVVSKEALGHDAAMESDAEMDVGQTEASGYGFSQGAFRADSEVEVSMEGEEQEFESEQPETEADAKGEDVEPQALVAAPEEEEAKDSQPLSPPTEAELYTVVDSIFESADKNTMTVKQVNKSVAAHFSMDKVDKEMKGLIKERLTKLVSGQIKVGSTAVKKSKKEKKPKKEKMAVEPEEEFEGDVESEEEVNYDSSSDYDEASAKKSRKSRKKQTVDTSLSDDSIASDKPRKSRKRRSSTGKMAKHLRDHATKLRERQIEESRIRQEELGNIAAKEEEGPKLSEEDRARAQAIAARFDTNREEELVKREEDRAGLIDVLRRKRLEIITLDDDKVQDVVETTETVKSEVMIDLEDDEEESSDEELELVAPVKKPSAMDCLMAKPGDIPAPIFRAAKPKPVANSRLALRNALRAKQVKAGNRWLARELGYKTEEDHIKECMEVEMKKRKQIFLLEKQAALGIKKELGASNPAFDVPADDPDEASGDEEDEELAMAKQLENSEVKSEAGDDADDEEMFETGDGGFDEEENAEHDDAPQNPTEELGEPKSTAEAPTPAPSPTKTVTSIVSPSGSRLVSTETSEAEVHDDLLGNEKVDIANESTENELDEMHIDDSNDDQAEADATEAVESDAEETKSKSKSNKPKNSAWKEMLRKEKEMLAKEKKRKGGGLVEGEAEEEEEEEGIVGLEDFGFSVEKKKDDDADEDDAEADEDDLEHVVDDLSDGEGDEEAGEQARKQLEAREEKERHKEIMRRMREGYDGRRGGIASGAGARGIYRFDQLVAADNREDAKRLGLLNEDEMDSDDENENGEAKEKKDAADDEDEAALLDKMLKERFLNRDEEDVFEENFSDSEAEDIDEEQANGDNPEDDEEKEQDRLAKQFAKRARMNRILEAYEGDTEFSRSRLIDEDVSMHIELKTMKTTQAKKRGSIFTEASNLGSSLFKRQKSDSNFGSQQSEKSFKPATTFTSQEGSLSVALLASRSAGRKRKTTFLSGKQSTSFSRQSSSNKSVSLSHVVFVTGESQGASQLSKSASEKPSTSKKPTAKFSASSSLWNRAISKNWSK
ncbi:hypothetical protein ACHAWO_008572 [Cyclotella atomus]|uniref:DEK-C domain-containing protein n=1 Tax=Cyclotella atomus TaxID=382360 RepID=A0ABD3PGS0_9STRA